MNSARMIALISLVVGASLAAMITSVDADSYNFRPLDDWSLGNARGGDPHTYQISSITCEEKWATRENQLNGQTNNIGSGDCHSQGDNPEISYICWTCSSPGSNVEILVDTDNVHFRSGLRKNDTVSCGPANSGECMLMSSAWMCENIQQKMYDCVDIDEYFIQGY